MGKVKKNKKLQKKALGLPYVTHAQAAKISDQMEDIDENLGDGSLISQKNMY